MVLKIDNEKKQFRHGGRKIDVTHVSDDDRKEGLSPKKLTSSMV
jgi:hypothetical protein